MNSRIDRVRRGLAAYGISAIKNHGPTIAVAAANQNRVGTRKRTRMKRVLLTVSELHEKTSRSFSQIGSVLSALTTRLESLETLAGDRKTIPTIVHQQEGGVVVEEESMDSSDGARF